MYTTVASLQTLDCTEYTGISYDRSITRSLHMVRVSTKSPIQQLRCFLFLFLFFTLHTWYNTWYYFYGYVIGSNTEATRLPGHNVSIPDSDYYVLLQQVGMVLRDRTMANIYPLVGSTPFYPGRYAGKPGQKPVQVYYGYVVGTWRHTKATNYPGIVVSTRS